jgi:putative phosphoesterase
LDVLSSIAPLTAVRGNNDAALAQTLGVTATLRVEEILLGVIHERSLIAAQPPCPALDGAHVVICGHSHKPRIDERDGVLFINPGSAGPRRFSLPIAIGDLTIDRDALTVRIVDLGAAEQLLLGCRRPRPALG